MLGTQRSPHGIDNPFFFNVPRCGTAWDGHDSDEQRAAADPRADRCHHRLVQFFSSGNPSSTRLGWPMSEIPDPHWRLIATSRSSRMCGEMSARLSLALATVGVLDPLREKRFGTIERVRLTSSVSPSSQPIPSTRPLSQVRGLSQFRGRVALKAGRRRRTS